MFKHQLTKLDCGLTLLSVPMEIESVTVLLLANTGSRYEIPAKQGVAHFFEHMVFKGTAKFPDALTLAETVDRIGADFNAFTSKEYTGYYVKAAAEHLELSLEVLSDMILLPKLRQEDIDREKGVIIEELNMYVDTPSRYIGNLFEQEVYLGSGLSHDIIGTKETIRGMQANDFQQFLAEWYDLSNMTLVMAGKKGVLEATATQHLVNQIFKKKYQPRKNEQLARQARLANWQDSPLSDHKLHIENRDTQQAHFVLGWPGIKRGDSRRFALNLLAVIIGGNMSSRLFTEVREKRGLAYYVNSDVDQYHDGGIFGASAGVDLARIQEALEVTIQQFTALIEGKNQIKESELQKAKDYVVGKMILGFEESEAVAQFFGLKRLLMEKIETPEEIIEQIKRVTLNEVNQVANDLIKKDQLRLAVIGQFNDEQKKYFESLVNV